jgi:hypothetical protein
VAASEPAAADAPACKDAGVKVTFVRGSAELDTNGRGALAGVAVWLQNGEQRTVRLMGFADRSGGATGNQRLSERRAQAAKDYLVGRGISPERVMAFGHGEQDDQRLAGAPARVVLVTACEVPGQTAAAAPEAPSAPESGTAGEPEPQAAPAPAPAPAPPAKPARTPAPRAPLPPAPLPAPAPGAPPAPVAPLPPPPPVGTNAYAPLTGLGIEATVGGGAIGFIDQGSRSFSGTGAAWDARVLVGSRLPLAIETAYIGSVQNIDALGLSTDAFLVGNGVEGTLRVNLIRARVQPYLFGGVGWTHYRVTNTPTNTSSVLGADDVGTIPMGGGITARIVGSFIADVRAVYRATFSDDLLRATAATNGNSLQSWNVGGRIGFEF